MNDFIGRISPLNHRLFECRLASYFADLIPPVHHNGDDGDTIKGTDGDDWNQNVGSVKGMHGDLYLVTGGRGPKSGTEGFAAGSRSMIAQRNQPQVLHQASVRFPRDAA